MLLPCRCKQACLPSAVQIHTIITSAAVYLSLWTAEKLTHSTANYFDMFVQVPC